MKTIVAVAIICAALYVQASPPVTFGKDEVKKAFHGLMGLVDKAINTAQGLLDKAMNAVKAESTKLESTAQVGLDKVLQPLRTKLNDLVQKAKQKGFNVGKCQSYVDHFSKTPDRLLYNLVECVNGQISKAQGYVDDALNNARKMERDLNTIDTDIDKCDGSFVQKTECYAEIMKTIIMDTKSVPVHIVEDATKTTALVTGILPYLELCSVNQLKNAGLDAAKDVADFAICAA